MKCVSQVRTNEPSYVSTAKNGKHQDIVWQVNQKLDIFI